jgi:signal transduction histidine kinase
MMGELAASLAHEIKQPIAASVTNAQTCVRWLRRDVPDVVEASNAASRTVKDPMRAAEILDRVRSLYTRDTPQRELVEVNEMIREMMVLLRDKVSRNFISIHTVLDPEAPAISADRVQLQQVLMNLMLNAIDAMKDLGGELTIASKRIAEGQLLISVSDSGVGLPAEKLESILEAFFTTKREGTGMDWRSAERLLSRMAAVYGRRRMPDAVRRFNLHSPAQRQHPQAPPRNLNSTTLDSFVAARVDALTAVVHSSTLTFVSPATFNCK